MLVSVLLPYTAKTTTDDDDDVVMVSSTEYNISGMAAYAVFIQSGIF